MILALAACAPPIDGTRPTFPFAAGWQTPLDGAARLMDEREWWRGLQDPTLDQLVARALKGSPDLAAARLRAEAARAQTGAVPGPTTVTADISARDSEGEFRTEDSLANGRLGIEAIFDPGRGRQAERRGAAAQAEYAAAAHAGARLFLIGEVCDAYLNLRHQQQQLSVVLAETGRQKQLLELAGQLKAEGQASDIDTLRGEAQLASLRAERPALEAAIGKWKARLAILAGDAPGALPDALEAALDSTGGQPRARLAPDLGIPADLVRNRPDLRMDEADYDLARARLGKARAAYYPRLALSGTFEVRDVRSQGQRVDGDVSSFLPAIRLPSLPLNSTKAGVDAASAQVEAAYKVWTASTLNALYEVEAALLDYRAAARTEQSIDRAVALNSEARGLMKAAVTEGDATLADLSDVERDLSLAQRRQADARLARALSFVELNLRLGMGSALPERAAQPVAAAGPKP